MARTLQDIIYTEFDNEIDNIPSVMPKMAQHAFDALRQMKVSEKLFPKVSKPIYFKNGIAPLPNNFYKEYEDFFCDNIDYSVTIDIHKNKIKASVPDDISVCISYYAIHTDENGYPVIPEDNGIDIAIAAYLRYIYMRSRYYAGEVGIERMKVAEDSWNLLRQTTRGMAKMPNKMQYIRITTKLM